MVDLPFQVSVPCDATEGDPTNGSTCQGAGDHDVEVIGTATDIARRDDRA